MSTPQNIVGNAEYQARLLSTLAELDYVPSEPALAQQTTDIKEVKTQFTAGEAKLKRKKISYNDASGATGA